MPKFQPRQAVVSAQSDHQPEVHDALHVAELPDGEPQYRIKGRDADREGTMEINRVAPPPATPGGMHA